MDFFNVISLGIVFCALTGDLITGQTISVSKIPSCSFDGNDTILQCTVSGTGLAPRWKNPTGKDVSSGCSILDNSVKSISCDDNAFPSEVNITLVASTNETFFGPWECSIDSTTYQTLDVESLYVLNNNNLLVLPSTSLFVEPFSTVSITCGSPCTYPEADLSWRNLGNLETTIVNESLVCSSNHLSQSSSNLTIKWDEQGTSTSIECVAKQIHPCFEPPNEAIKEITVEFGSVTSTESGWPTSTGTKSSSRQTTKASIFTETTASTPETPSPALGAGAIAGIVLAVLVLIGGIATGIFFCHKGRRSKDPPCDYDPKVETVAEINEIQPRETHSGNTASQENSVAKHAAPSSNKTPTPTGTHEQLRFKPGGYPEDPPRDYDSKVQTVAQKNEIQPRETHSGNTISHENGVEKHAVPSSNKKPTPTHHYEQLRSQSEGLVTPC